MAYSIQTKKILADSFKSIIEKKPFKRITVSEICEPCNINRKSFYYHFKDKYDLVCWIFDQEFLCTIVNYDNNLIWFEELCLYIEKNIKFYKKVLEVDGQNSFSCYLESLISESLKKNFNEIYINEPDAEFCSIFYSDALVCAVKRWVLNNSFNLSAKEFVILLKKCVMVYPHKGNE